MAVAFEPPLECGKNEIFTTYSSFWIQNPLVRGLASVRPALARVLIKETVIFTNAKC